MRQEMVPLVVTEVGKKAGRRDDQHHEAFLQKLRANAYMNFTLKLESDRVISGQRRRLKKTPIEKRCARSDDHLVVATLGLLAITTRQRTARQVWIRRARAATAKPQ